MVEFAALWTAKVAVLALCALQIFFILSMVANVFSMEVLIPDRKRDRIAIMLLLTLGTPLMVFAAILEQNA